MANTFSQITIHAVFAVKNRENFIQKNWRDNLYKYIAGILKNIDVKPLAIGGWLDHVHILFGMPVTTNIADIMRVVKTNSSKWINTQNFLNSKFEWQAGYGAFSFSKSQRDIVINYIKNQEEHHKKKSFKDEYKKMLNDFEIEYNETYLFEFYE